MTPFTRTGFKYSLIATIKEVSNQTEDGLTDSHDNLLIKIRQETHRGILKILKVLSHFYGRHGNSLFSAKRSLLLS